MLGLGKEVGQNAAVQLILANLAALKKLLAGRVERSVQERQECECLWCEDLLLVIVDLAEDVDALEDGGRVGSHVDCRCV